MSLTAPGASHGKLRDYLMQQDPDLAEAANTTWSTARQIHDRQTKTGGNVGGQPHCERVEDNIWRLLDETHDRSPERKKHLLSFSPVELYLLSCAACCHDFDKGLHDAVLPDGFKHGEGSSIFVHRNWLALGIKSEAAAEYIDSIIRIHDCKEDFDERLQEIDERYTLLNTTGDLRRLATLLKTADTLHLDESRVSRLAVPDESLQGFDRLKQRARGNIHGWRPDGERIIIKVSIKSQEVGEALRECENYIRNREWPPIRRNLLAYHFPYRLQFEWKCPPTLREKLVAEGIICENGPDLVFANSASGKLAPESLQIDSFLSNEPLKLIAVPPSALAEHLAMTGPLSVIDNTYIPPSFTDLGAAAGAINTIFVGRADCGKTRAAYEWIRRTVGDDLHAWVVIRPSYGSIPLDASQFLVDFDTHYAAGQPRPRKAILFADDLPDYLPPQGSGTAATEAVHRLFQWWFHEYGEFQERCFVGTIRSERTHDKPDWPNCLVHLGDLQLKRVEPLDAEQRCDLWKGMSQGRAFRDQVWDGMDLAIDDEFLEDVNALDADPEAIAYYVREIAGQGRHRITREDAASFGTDVAKLWIRLTWPTVRATYGPAASVFLTLARFFEAASRPDSGFKISLPPAWEYHAVFGPPLLGTNGGNADDYLPALARMLKDGHAVGTEGESIRPRFDFLLQAQRLENIELPLPPSSWFASLAHDISSAGQSLVAFHFSSAGQPCTDASVTPDWLVGHAGAMNVMAKAQPELSTFWLLQELEAYDELVSRFGGDETPTAREVIAMSLFNKGATLGQLERRDESLDVYEELLMRFRHDDTPGIRIRVAKGLVNWGIALGSLGRDHEALEVFRELLKHFYNDDTPEIREQVAKGLVNEGVALKRLGRNDEALQVYGDFLNRFGKDQMPAIRKLVAKGLADKSTTLESLGRHSEAFEINEELLKRFANDKTPEGRKQAAASLFRKATVLIAMDKNDEALATWNKLLQQFHDDPDPNVIVDVAGCLVGKGLVLELTHKEHEALQAYDEAIRRMRHGHNPFERGVVALALEGKCRILQKMNRHEAAVSASDEVVKLFGDDPNPALRKTVAIGLNIQSASLNALWHELQDQNLLARAIIAGRGAVAMGANCYNLACLLALAGEKDEAFELLERSLSEEQISWTHVAQDMDWDGLREDSRYQNLASEYGGRSASTERAAEEPDR
jgi:tetratricopeptide (TPR) repeat protein